MALMTRVVLLDAQGFHRNMLEVFPYVPSEESKRALGPGAVVCLRAMEVDDEGGGDFWGSTPLWAKIERVDESGLVGSVSIGGDLEGYRDGDEVHFEARHVFDFYGPDSWYNPERLPSLVGKTVLVGVTVFSADDVELGRYQYFGRIRGIERPHGLVLELGDGRFLDMPPSFSQLKEARSGTYRLRESGEVVEDPDFISVATLKLPPGRTEWSGPRRP